MIPKSANLGQPIMGVLSPKIDKVNKKISDKEGDLSRALIMPLVRRDPEIQEVKQRDRIMLAALSGIASLAASSGVAKLLLKNKRLRVPMIASSTATGIGSGYFAPDVINTLRRENSGAISEDESRDIIRNITESENRAGRKFKEISIMPFEKNSGLVGGALKAAKITAKGLAFGGRTIKKGLFTRTGLKKGEKTPFSRKLLGFGVKSGVIGGAGYGAYKINKKISGPMSRNNYTTHLRNNVLSGNIKPREMSQEDLISVRKLGLN